MSKKSNRLSLIFYRISRALISAVSSVILAMTSIGSWQSMSSPYQYNHKNFSYHETNFIDIFFGFTLSILFGIFSLAAFIYLLLFTFDSKASNEFYSKRNETDT